MTKNLGNLSPETPVPVTPRKPRQFSVLVILLVAGLLSSCGQPGLDQPPAPPSQVDRATIPPVNVPPTAISLTSTPSPTQPATETTPPTPSETPPLDTIPHLQAGTSVTISSINMFDEKNGWALGGLPGESTHILSTDDGSLSWKDVTPPQVIPSQSQPLQAAAGFLDPQLAWVFYMQSDSTVVESAVVWYTQDSGLHWQASQPLDLTGLESQFYISNIFFIDPLNGWLLAHVGVGMNHDYVMLYRSRDGGQSWQRLIDPYMDGGIQACQKTGMLFTDPQQGWLPGDCNGVAPGAFLYHTTDGGETWETINLASPSDQPTLFETPTAACGVYDVTFFTPDFGRAGVTCANYATDPLTYLHYLYTTQDGGATWTAVEFPGGSLIFLNDQLGWTQNGEIYHSADGGLTWTIISQVTWEADFDFVSEKLGWAVARLGDETALLFSGDGGVYWAVINPTILP